MKNFSQKNLRVFELKFCCSCFKKFKDKTLKEFPDNLIKKIQKKIEDFNLERKENEN